MKEIELKLISELMKNSRRSDRELAKVLKVSQPTTTRLRTKLEKQGHIKEYTMLPDFRKLGFEIMALTLVKQKKDLTKEEYDEIRKFAGKFEEKNPFALMMAVSGTGLGFNNVVISFHEDYESFRKFVNATKQVPLVEIADFESFIISLAEEQYHPLTFSTVSKYIATLKPKKE